MLMGYHSVKKILSPKAAGAKLIVSPKLSCPFHITICHQLLAFSTLYGESTHICSLLKILIPEPEATIIANPVRLWVPGLEDVIPRIVGGVEPFDSIVTLQTSADCWHLRLLKTVPTRAPNAHHYLRHIDPCSTRITVPPAPP